MVLSSIVKLCNYSFKIAAKLRRNCSFVYDFEMIRVVLDRHQIDETCGWFGLAPRCLVVPCGNSFYRVLAAYGLDCRRLELILTWLRGYRDHEGGSPRARPFHCTSVGLTPAITPNVGNSGVQFLLAG